MSEPVLKTEIKNIYKNLLNEQLSEKISEIIVNIFNNKVSIQAENCLSPGEQNLIRDEKNWQLLHEIKTKSFESIKPLLIMSIEDKTNCSITRIHSFIDKLGFRYELITFDQNIEEILTEAKSPS